MFRWWGMTSYCIVTRDICITFDPTKQTQKIWNEETERVAVFEAGFDGPSGGQCPANSGLFEWEFFWTIL